jgi:mannosyltransferase
VPVWASQRTPYAKNGSDWNDIAFVIRGEALSGDAIVFDDGTRPSRRPRLALDTDPSAFAAVRDITLASPYPRNPTWHDITMSVDEAAAAGRLRGVHRVWVVEYRSAAGVDSWALSALRHRGFRERERITQHSSVVFLFTD